jgi:hypothetical protein
MLPMTAPIRLRLDQAKHFVGPPAYEQLNRLDLRQLADVVRW